MENLIYLAVKGLLAVYLLHRLFRFLFGKRVEKFWRFLTPETLTEKKAPAPVPETVPYNMVGKSQTVYLEEIPKEKAVEPLFSEDLEKEEPETADSDVEESLNKDGLLEADRFISLDTDVEEDFPSSTGMTYEQISEALDAVQGKSTDDAGRQAAARILCEMEGSDLFNFLTAQAENEALVEKLIRENMDNSDVPPENTRKQRRKKTEDFNMDKYV